MGKKLVRIRRHPFVIQDEETKEYVETVTFSKAGLAVTYTPTLETAARGTSVLAERIRQIIATGKHKITQIKESV